MVPAFMLSMVSNKGTNDIEILNNDFKKAYKSYLEKHFKSSFFVKNVGKPVDRVLKSVII